MSEDVLTDALWERRAPLVPVRPRRFRYPGRRPADDHTVLAGILFVLRYDLPWRYLPASFGVSEVTCGRRLRDWAKAGVWQQLHERLLAKLRAASRLDLHRVLVESSHLPALKGGMPRLEPGQPGPPRLHTPPGHWCRWRPARGHRYRRQPP